MTVAALAFLMLQWLRHKVEAEGKNILVMALLLAYTCVLFLPSMHERYVYPCEILAVVLAVLMPKTLPLCAGMVGISLCTYGSYLFGNEVFSLQVLTLINLAVYAGYVWYLNWKLLQKKMLSPWNARVIVKQYTLEAEGRKTNEMVTTNERF